MPKGQKKTKGTPELYNEVKKQVSLSLTPTAIAKLDNLANKHKLSRSEFVEQVARGLIPPTEIGEKNSVSKEFILYPTQSLSMQERNKLPEEMGSFLISDLTNFAYIDSCSNLNKRFQNPDFLKSIEHISERINEIRTISKINYNPMIFWIKCESERNIHKTESELISQFRSSENYFSSFSIQKYISKYANNSHYKSKKKD